MVRGDVSWLAFHTISMPDLGAFAIGIGLATANRFGPGATWSVIADVVLTVGGCCVAYLRWLRKRLKLKLSSDRVS